MKFWWLTGLDRGALINVGTPGGGVVRGPMPHKYEGFHPGYTCTQRFPRESVYFSSHAKVTQPRPNRRGHHGIRVNP